MPDKQEARKLVNTGQALIVASPAFRDLRFAVEGFPNHVTFHSFIQ